MWIWEYSVRIYYAFKSYYDYYFKKNNSLQYNLNQNISEENKKKIEDMEDGLINLYEQIDIKYIYNCLSVINTEFDKKTKISKILDFLEKESQFIFQSKENLEISLNKIKENTYVLELISKFKLLDEIHKKEKELNDFKKSI